MRVDCRANQKRFNERDTAERVSLSGEREKEGREGENFLLSSHSVGGVFLLFCSVYAAAPAPAGT